MRTAGATVATGHSPGTIVPRNVWIIDQSSGSNAITTESLNFPEALRKARLHVLAASLIP